MDVERDTWRTKREKGGEWGGLSVSGLLQPKQSQDGKGVSSPSAEVFNSRAMATWQEYSGVGAEVDVLWTRCGGGAHLPDVEQIVLLLADEVGVEQQVAVAPIEVAHPLGLHRHQI